MPWSVCPALNRLRAPGVETIPTRPAFSFRSSLLTGRYGIIMEYYGVACSGTEEQHSCSCWIYRLGSRRLVLASCTVGNASAILFARSIKPASITRLSAMRLAPKAESQSWPGNKAFLSRTFRYCRRAMGTVRVVLRYRCMLSRSLCVCV